MENIQKPITILAIETSCDETAAAVVADGKKVLSSVIASQTQLHQPFGGVVPEVASRAHVEAILPVIREAMSRARVQAEKIDAVAAANQPGLAIALVVGLAAAKTLALAWRKPLIAVNHIIAHLYSALMDQEELLLPAVALVVSGGHTNLYHIPTLDNIQLVGRTIDDAAGEAFDKVAMLLGLPYPGGPSIEKIAAQGRPNAIFFPRTLLEKESLDFSFSGLKTAVLYYCQGQDMKGHNRAASFSTAELADVAASFQAAVIDSLVEKVRRAVVRYQARSILMAGGVAANQVLRSAMVLLADQYGCALHTAPRPLCTDNAAMIGALAYREYIAGRFAPLSIEPKAR